MPQNNPRCYACGKLAQSPMLPLCLQHDLQRLQLGMTAEAVLRDARLPKEQRVLRFRARLS
jgi:hypothetical protein